jgi:hypothetical protein
VTSTNADALVALADVAGAGSSDDHDSAGGASGGDRYQVLVQVDLAALAGGDEPPGDAECRTADGSALAPETARRLACDCSLVPLGLSEDGSVLDAGRKRRSVPPALRRAVRIRDETCTFPGCEHRRFIEGHHIRHWAHGGETSKDNITQLCKWHHRLLHEGGYSVERLRDGRLVFRDCHGVRVASPALPRGHAGQLEELATDRRTGIPPHPGSGENLDLDLTLLTLGQRANSAATSSSASS